MLHPSLQSLTLVISSTLPALHTIDFQNHICSLNFNFQKSSLNPLNTVIALLRQLPVPCQWLGLLLPQQLNGDTLREFFHQLVAQSNCNPYATICSLSNLSQFTIRVDAYTLHNCVPLLSNFLEPLYPFLLTDVHLGTFNMCHLANDDLHSLSFTMPQLSEVGPWYFAAILHNCPALKQLGLAFSCSLGTLDFDILPINKCITSFNIGISPLYNHYAVAHFLSSSLPNLCRIHVEYIDLALTQHNHILADQLLHVKGWQNILNMRSTVVRPLSYSCINL
jgi:hypothetical protein